MCISLKSITSFVSQKLSNASIIHHISQFSWQQDDNVFHAPKTKKEKKNIYYVVIMWCSPLPSKRKKLLFTMSLISQQQDLLEHDTCILSKILTGGKIFGKKFRKYLIIFQILKTCGNSKNYLIPFWLGIQRLKFYSYFWIITHLCFVNKNY